MVMAFSGHIFGTTEAAMPFARVRRFYLTPPSLFAFAISVVLAILAVLVNYRHVGLFQLSYAFPVLLIGYIVLVIGCMFRRA
jgi:hypothetical protein